MAKKKSTAKGPSTVRVRMYRQGLGDCFLISFPKPDDKGDFFILIDCGVILGTPNAATLMKAVVEDIAETTNKKIDVLVATHEHWDHVSGFDQAKDLFEDGFQFKQVWLAWTEDPKDEIANRLRQHRAMRLAALWLGLGQMRQRLAADGADNEAKDTIERASEVLSFFGIDPNDPPPTGGFGAAAAAAGGKTAAAMHWVRDKTPNPRFCEPGDLIELPEAGGVRVYVLGPPTDQKQLFKDLPTRSGKETYEVAKTHPAAAERAFFAAAFQTEDTHGVQPNFDKTLPFDRRFQIMRADAANIEFFRDHYFGAGDEAADPWRQIEQEWMAGAAEFALALDSDTNNTSLALAFELPDGRVLLFPGDAQVGNWESWHADSEGKKRIWKVDEREVTAEMLLNRTVFYKVGHHGSHNATLREKGLEMMTDPDLVALVPVDVYIAHVKKRWTKMPFDPLMHRLADMTRGRVVQADQARKALEDMAADATNPHRETIGSFLPRVTDAKTMIEVACAVDGKEATIERPLYVEYVLS